MKKKYSPFVFILFLFVSLLQAQVPAIEREALISLYNATNGDTWNTNTNWNTAAPVNTWFGVTVVGGNVTALDLNNTNDLAGSNNLTGAIPDEIGNLQSLTLLDLSYGNLTGNIPNTLLNCTNLESLYLHSNNLEGAVPNFSALTNFNNFLIENNRFQFGDFETEFNNYNTTLDSFSVSPQAKVDLEETISVCGGMRINMSTTVSGLENTYQWYKGVYPNGLILPGKNDSDLTFNFGNMTNAGNYYCLIKNNTVTNLTLVRNQITVEVSNNDVFPGVVTFGLFTCDENDDGIVPFFNFNTIHLPVIESQAGSGQENIEFDYFEPDGTPVDFSIVPYINTTPYIQTIIVRISSTVSDCYAETSFDLKIGNTINPEDQVACDSYVLPPRTFGEYYTGPNSTGTLLNPGHVITSSQTIYVWDRDSCVRRESFEVTIYDSPVLDPVIDQEACTSFELPILTVGDYFSEPNGTGTSLNAGDVITTPQTIYIYAETQTNPNCVSEISFDVSFTTEPNVDIIADQIVCSSYILPILTNGNYFTGANGTGNTLNAGDIITVSQTIYIYNESGVAPDICSAETNFNVTINNIPDVDSITNREACNSFNLPTLTNGNYFTEPNGAGTQLNSGDTIGTSQTIYIYAETGIAPNLCSAESNFDVTIITAPDIDIIVDQVTCDSYTLPVITNGNYFTEINGTGNPLNAGDTITTSQTVYIYAEVGTAPNTCSVESNFTVTINETPNVDNLANVVACNSYTLLPLTIGNYFTATNGGGTQLLAGDLVTTSQTIYIFAESGIGTNLCSGESNFDITINTAPNVDVIADQITCDDYTLLPLTSGNYFTAINGGGTQLLAGDLITTSQTIYIYAETGIAPNACYTESNFSITINNTPIVDTLPNVTTCGNYTLPTLTNGNYFTGTNGTGNSLNEGDLISSSQTIFIYAEAPNSPDCNAETSFTITINEQPIVDELDGVTSCDSYTLQPLNNGNYYTEANGNGTTLNAGEIITTSQTVYIFTQTGIAPNTCLAESDFTINIVPTETFELTEDNLTLVDQDVTVTINSNQNLEYAVDNAPFQTSNVFFNLSEGLHTITVRTEGGCFEESITFIIKVKKFIIPKFLTPNGDGFKDSWTVIDTENRIKNIYIFDRYGKLIKTLTPSSNFSWDGTYNGKQLPTSDYWYTIQLKDNKIFKGHFALKR